MFREILKDEFWLYAIGAVAANAFFFLAFHVLAFYCE